MRVEPIFDRVIVKCDPIADTSEGGIILTDTAKHLHPTRDAVVLAVGPGKRAKNGKLVEMTVKVGDRVQINGIAGVSEEGNQGKKAKDEEIVITESDIYFIYGDNQ